MTEVLHSSQSSSPLSCAPSSSSSPSTTTTTTTHNNNNDAALFCNPFSEQGEERVEGEEVCSAVVPVAAAAEEVNEIERERRREQQLSLLAVLLTLFRKSFWMACKTDPEDVIPNGMEIGWPTNVRHVAHVTFDRFNGFLGLPVEFEPEVPRRAPSARSSFFFFLVIIFFFISSSSSSLSFSCSTTVFGVSTESMQLSFDSRGNSVPTILLLMQHRLYVQGGLQSEGIFRINPENSQEEFVREQLNRGILPQGIDVHTLAGLIKAWFRELPTGILDSLSPEQVTQSQSEEEYSALVTLLPSTQAALLSWAVNLMADVVQMEHVNKMNAHNVAMVFAPNMTQMVDPLTALMYAVQVMNFLKSLITKTLREREQDSAIAPASLSCTDPPPPSDDPTPENSTLIGEEEGEEEEEHNDAFFTSESNEPGNTTDGSSSSKEEKCEFHNDRIGSIISHSSGLLVRQSSVKDTVNADLQLLTDKGGKGISNLSRINSLVERKEAWR